MSAIVGLMATALAQVPASPATCLATPRPEAGDFQRATQRVYHAAECASRIEMTVLTNNRWG